LPQANRPPLGKGPTGKDKPKSYDNQAHSRSESSSPDSPDSMRDSVSPVIVSASLPPRAAVQEIENGTGPWGQTIVMTEEVPQYQPLPPMSAPLPSKNNLPYSPPYPSSRSSSLAPMYMYGSPDRGYSPHFEPQQQQLQQQRSYSYSAAQQSYGESLHTSPTVREGPPSGGVAVGYPPRRATADFSIGQGFPHLPTPIQPPNNIRLPSPPRGLQEHPHHGHHDLHNPHSQHDPHTHHRPAYTTNGHIIS
jgi:hypothetical protein